MAHIIGKRVYYRKDTGAILYETEDRIQLARDTTVQEDLASVKKLAELDSSLIGYIQFCYKELNEKLILNNANTYTVDPKTEELIFAYVDENGETVEPPSEKTVLLNKITELDQKIDEAALNSAMAIAELAEELMGV